MTEEMQRQQDAFKVYQQAKLKADETLNFDDAMAAKRAWWAFLQIFEALTVEPPIK